MARHSSELATVHGEPLPTNQPAALGELNQLRPGCCHRIAVHASELGDGLVVRVEPAHQPHQFHIAAALSFKPPRRTNLVQISVEI